MDRGVVLGGSVAGLLAARVLSDHASEVVIVERDDLAGGPATRRGVPQGEHVHGLLGRGLEQIEALFPGITREMFDDGAEVADPGVDLHWYVDGRRKPPSGIGQGISCTRPFLEWHLRRRLTALKGIRVVKGRAEGLTVVTGRVDGVALSGSEHEGEHLSADFVVDCTGKSTRIETWLAAHAYDAPPQRRVNVGLGYASRFYARTPDEHLGGGRAVVSLTEDLDCVRGAAALPVEGGRWLVTVGGYDQDRPSSDPADYASRLGGDPCIALRQFAHRGDMVSDVTTYRYPVSVRRDFHRCRRLPGSLVAAGDSVASFNPIYGQGMTSAALQAVTLGDYLASGASPRQPAERYFRRPVIMFGARPVFAEQYTVRYFAQTVDAGDNVLAFSRWPTQLARGRHLELVYSKWHQQAVLVPNIEMVQNIHGMITVGPAVLKRLRPLDDMQPLGGKHFQLTADVSRPIFCFADTRKADAVVLRVPAVSGRQMPHDVVQRHPEVTNEVCKDDEQGHRNAGSFYQAHLEPARFVVWLPPDCVRAAFSPFIKLARPVVVMLNSSTKLPPDGIQCIHYASPSEDADTGTEGRTDSGDARGPRDPDGDS